MHKINIHEAKTHFSKLINAVISGKEVVIAKAGKPVAKLVGIIKTKQPRRFGLLKSKIKIAKGFDALLSDDVIRIFEGEE